MKISEIRTLLNKGEKIFFENNKDGFNNALRVITLLKGVVPNALNSSNSYFYIYNHNGSIILFKSLFSPKEGDLIVKSISYEDKEK